MSDQPENQAAEATDGAGTAPAPAAAVPPPVVPPPAFDSDAAATAASGDRPEVAVGAAFAGGFVLAMILRRLAR